MTSYTVSAISLAPIPGIHNGTGDQHDPTFGTVVPGSLPGSGELTFVGADVNVTTMLFQLNSTVVVPNWFGVAVPDGIQDFSRPNIFFHPTPGQAGYNDADYPTKAGLWPQLFYYMERLGKQVAGASRSQIVVMPFLTNAATNTGILSGIWHDTVTQILTQVRATFGADDGSTLSIAQVVVSSFSDGIIYSHFFRSLASDLPPLLAEIWDLDGGLSSYAAYSAALETDSHTVIQYDSASPSYARSYHLPPPRWAGFYDTSAIPKTALQVHPLIRDYMYLDAATVTGVGSVIPTTAPIAAPQATPSAPAAVPTAGPIAVPTAAPITVSPVAPKGVSPVAPVSPPQLISPQTTPFVSPFAITPASPGLPVAPGPSSPIAPPTSTQVPGGTPLQTVGQQAQAQGGSGQQVPTSSQFVWLPQVPDCGCAVAVTGIAGVVATTAQTAISAITAIAALGARDDEQRTGG